MKNNNIFKLLTLLLLFATSETFSQNNLGIHIGISNPISDFASENPNNAMAAGAAIGFNIGLKYTYQLSDNGLGLFASLDFSRNSLTKDIKNDIEDVFESIGLLGANYTFYNYYNIPISAGLNYIYLPNEKVGLFTNVGITFNLLKLSDFVVEGSGVKITSKYDLASAFGFKVGGGIIINDKISIAIDYLGLGKHTINGKARVDGISSEDIDVEIKVNLLNITIGYNF